MSMSMSMPMDVHVHVHVMFMSMSCPCPCPSGHSAAHRHSAMSSCASKCKLGGALFWGVIVCLAAPVVGAASVAGADVSKSKGRRWAETQSRQPRIGPMTRMCFSNRIKWPPRVRAGGQSLWQGCRELASHVSTSPAPLAPLKHTWPRCRPLERETDVAPASSANAQCFSGHGNRRNRNCPMNRLHRVSQPVTFSLPPRRLGSQLPSGGFNRVTYVRHAESSRDVVPFRVQQLGRQGEPVVSQPSPVGDGMGLTSEVPGGEH
ncbi:hypothetical protein B0T26DRAFT_186342 [Lasiosphaeria miniovina]|uniref:Uncharacterized protein n=1 Tax=Lasiosphaeria miniovina TaxID=1954250 RepID=A0AA40B6Z5_9PEZI|nr:uncharacterized protein B0T26DRAFT_186342 [Lasiosphaeria miniovina]KAK0728845.1 hypothetical protein B0T26DRAFT_186342 [Lasiosphaeria miniovina]